mgnify:CR=1 FL=1
MSKDSAFFANARKKDVKTDQRIAACRAKLKSFYQPSGMDRYAQAQRRGGPPSTTAPPTTADTAAARRAQTKAEMLCQTIEESRDLSRTWVCVDMDMFFAAVAMRDDPSLRDIPMAIGGIGMISTANYKAREYGVRSAMPGFIAKQLCPHLKFVRADSTAIKEAAMQARRVFAEYDPNFSSMSMDEAKLDITKYLKRTTDGGGDSGSDDDSDDGDDDRKDLPTRGLKSAELHWADRAGVIEHAGQMPVLEGIEAECAKINALLARGGGCLEDAARRGDPDSDSDGGDAPTTTAYDGVGPRPLCRAERVVAEIRARSCSSVALRWLPTSCNPQKLLLFGQEFCWPLDLLAVLVLRRMGCLQRSLLIWTRCGSLSALC